MPAGMARVKHGATFIRTPQLDGVEADLIATALLARLVRQLLTVHGGLVDVLHIARYLVAQFRWE
jgi:hypothetical protein